MESRELAFVTVMAVLIAIAVIVWLVYLGTRRRGSAPPAPLPEVDLVVGTRWYEYLLAALLLLGLVALGAWLLVGGFTGPAGENAIDWRSQERTTVLLSLIAVVVGVSLLAFIIYALRQLPTTSAKAVTAAEQAAGDSAIRYETPPAARLLGLLLFVPMILLLGWLYLPYQQQYQLMLNLIYPASLGVALVLLFDKATRRWSPKSSWPSVREWLFCDGITFLLVMGFVNLLKLEDGQAYRAFFWDVLHIVLFFFVFWLVDRRLARARFVVAQAYLLVLPLLLLLWRRSQEISPPEALGWWVTIWPFVCLAVIAMVLEIIALLVSSDSDNRALPALKDIIFVALYAILLINAIPEAVAAAQ